MTKATETETDPTPPTPRAPAAAAAATVEVTAAQADGREDYTVTDRAGPKVAGQRVKKGHTLRLTEAEARSELLSGTIVRKGEKPAEMFTRKGPSKAA